MLKKKIRVIFIKHLTWCLVQSRYLINCSYYYFKDLLLIFREGEKDWLTASCTLPGGEWAHHLGMCPVWESNQQPFGIQDNAQPTEAHWPGLIAIIMLDSPSGHPKCAEYSLCYSLVYKWFSWRYSSWLYILFSARFSSQIPAYVNMSILIPCTLKSKEELILSTERLWLPSALSSGSRRTFYLYLCPVQSLQKEEHE